MAKEFTVCVKVSATGYSAAFISSSRGYVYSFGSDDSGLSLALHLKQLPATKYDYAECRSIETGDVEIFPIGASGVTHQRYSHPMSVTQVGSVSPSNCVSQVRTLLLAANVN